MNPSFRSDRAADVFRDALALRSHRASASAAVGQLPPLPQLNPGEPDQQDNTLAQIAGEVHYWISLPEAQREAGLARLEREPLYHQFFYVLALCRKAVAKLDEALASIELIWGTTDPREIACLKNALREPATTAPPEGSSLCAEQETFDRWCLTEREGDEGYVLPPLPNEAKTWLMTSAGQTDVLNLLDLFGMLRSFRLALLRNKPPHMSG